VAPVPGPLYLFNIEFIAFQKVEEVDKIDDNEGEFVPDGASEIEYDQTVDGHGDNQKTVKKKNLLPDFFIYNFLPVDPDYHSKDDHIFQGLDELKRVVHFPNKGFK
tara:strand:+ start:183 stop:500 length:318 start_codon:yes stop_codon:yes gene_type:complete